jgi:DNA polymerase III gamma/tau subunit
MIKQCYISKAKEAMRLADERVQVRDFEEAIKLCEEAIKYCPEERAVLEEKISFYRKRQEAARTRDEVTADRLMPDLAREQYDIQVLLQQGRELATAVIIQRRSAIFRKCC